MLLQYVIEASYPRIVGYRKKRGKIDTIFYAYGSFFSKILWLFFENIMAFFENIIYNWAWKLK
jgi:hypothetical protein